MKKNHFKSAVLIVALIMATSQMYAQQGNGQGQGNKKGQCNGYGKFMNIPDLTDSQIEKIKVLKTTHMKTVLPVKNEIGEKEAKLRTLMSAENVDMSKVNSLIDEISVKKAFMKKDGVKMAIEIRKILTEEQRVFFDMRMSSKKGCRKGGKGYGNSSCRGGGRGANCHNR